MFSVYFQTLETAYPERGTRLHTSDPSRPDNMIFFNTGSFIYKVLIKKIAF